MGTKLKTRPENTDRLPEVISRRLQVWGFKTSVFYNKLTGKDVVVFRCKYLTGEFTASKPFEVSVVISKNYDIPALPIANGMIFSVPFKKLDDALSFVKKWFVSLT